MTANNCNYTKEKLRNAVYKLATGSGDVRSRLCDAFCECWILTEKSFPKELRSDWLWIVREMNKCGPRYDNEGKVRVDAIKNTMSKIRNSTGVKIAQNIYELKCKFDNYTSYR